MTAPIDPSKVPALEAAAAGAFTLLLFQRNTSKLAMFTTIFTAEVVAYYFALPTWALLHSNFAWATADWQGPVALSIGLLAIFIVGAIIKIASDFRDAPLETLAQLIRSIIQRITGKREG